VPGAWRKCDFLPSADVRSSKYTGVKSTGTAQQARAAADITSHIWYWIVCSCGGPTATRRVLGRRGQPTTVAKASFCHLERERC
jgi:hypothetical protein